MDINNQKYYTIDEVANLFRMKVEGVRRLVRLKRLKAFKPNPKQTLFTQEMIDEYENKTLFS